MRTLVDAARTVALVALIAAGGSVYVPASLTSAGATGLPGPCTTKNSVHIGPQVSPASQELAFTLSLTNETSKSCTVDSYPILKFTDAEGHVVAFRYSHRATGGYAMTKAPPTKLVLQPRRSAYVLVAKSSCVGPDRVRATKVGISVAWADAGTLKPGTNYKMVTLWSMKYPSFYTCAGPNAKADNVVAFTPLELSFRATL